MCSCMVSMSVSSYRCCINSILILSCVHPVAVLNAAFCMTCSLLMLDVELLRRLQTAVQTVSNPPSPSNGCPIYLFLQTGHADPLDEWCC